MTLCSAAKRCRRAVQVDALPAGDQPSVSAAWLARLRGEEARLPARRVYGGRAFGLAVQAADRFGADLGVISAGLGYVRADRPIPGYDLTVRPSGPGSVRRRIVGAFDPQAWWRAMREGPFSSDFAAELAGRPLVLACLSRAYVPMVADDLVAFMASAPTALRIFGQSIARHLPPALRPYVLPYDDRLGAIGLAGTRVDFPQRALHHYVTRVHPACGGDLDRERAAVMAALNGVDVPPARRLQRRVGDAELMTLIERLLPATGPSGSRMLTHLRRVEGVSCEQSRFAKIFRNVRQKQTA